MGLLKDYTYSKMRVYLFLVTTIEKLSPFKKKLNYFSEHLIFIYYVTWSGPPGSWNIIWWRSSSRNLRPKLSAWPYLRVNIPSVFCGKLSTTQSTSSPTQSHCNPFGSFPSAFSLFPWPPSTYSCLNIMSSTVITIWLFFKT